MKAACAIMACLVLVAVCDVANSKAVADSPKEDVTREATTLPEEYKLLLLHLYKAFILASDILKKSHSSAGGCIYMGHTDKPGEAPAEPPKQPPPPPPPAEPPTAVPQRPPPSATDQQQQR